MNLLQKFFMLLQQIDEIFITGISKFIVSCSSIMFAVADKILIFCRFCCNIYANIKVLSLKRLHTIGTIFSNFWSKLTTIRIRRLRASDNLMGCLELYALRLGIPGNSSIFTFLAASILSIPHVARTKRIIPDKINQFTKLKHIVQPVVLKKFHPKPKQIWVVLIDRTRLRADQFAKSRQNLYAFFDAHITIIVRNLKTSIIKEAIIFKDKARAIESNGKKLVSPIRHYFSALSGKIKIGKANYIRLNCVESFLQFQFLKALKTTRFFFLAQSLILSISSIFMKIISTEHFYGKKLYTPTLTVNKPKYGAVFNARNRFRHSIARISQRLSTSITAVKHSNVRQIDSLSGSVSLSCIIIHEWEYPVQNGDVLTITQSYECTTTDDTLIIS